ncbi:ornithine decarboxylase 1-like [Vespa mandarinia]|uniref:ornithine decarboxylase 1-like n=1 Tax=Vespa mandarinia TaxID=7446 RepID=UPI00160CED75|nr:ornithine decarboxylase 1-like [Vespa mandarinia]
MSSINVKEIHLYEDEIEENDIIKKIISTRDHEDTFYIFDFGVIIKKHQEWINKMPRVVPYYAIKCNTHSMVIKILAAMNANFDCASKQQEIQQVTELGISPDRIIFANPTKYPSHIKFAKSVGVEKMTADGKCELYKIKKLFPEAKIVIRFRCDGNSAVARCVKLGTKFGCEPRDEAKELIQLTKDLGLILYGFSFHVGSPCVEFNAYVRGIEICKELITFAKSIECNDIKLIDIGGGFPGESEFQIDEISHLVNDAIKDIDPTIEIISEPGRYYVTSAFTLASVVHSKRTVSVENNLKQMYYVSCGVYSGFIEELLKLNSRHPKALFNPVSDKEYYSTVWGPTCDSYDYIVKDILMPELQIGDWFIWNNMGAYAASRSCEFNGISLPIVHPFIRKSQWEDFCIIMNRFIND